MFCRTQSLSNATFSFLITWCSSSSKSAAVYKLSWKSNDFSLRCGDIDFQNGGRPPSWNCFTTIRDHPRSLCCLLQLPVNFHVNVIHRSEDIAIWIFTYLAWNAYSGPQNGFFWRIWTPKCDYSSSKPPQGTSLRKFPSFKLSTVKIRWRVWPVGELTESVTDTQTDTHTHSGKFVFCPCIALDRQLCRTTRWCVWLVSKRSLVVCNTVGRCSKYRNPGYPPCTS